ncbi:hypothetical protein [Thiohalophilus thiocyanatoxydans]|uniref:Uncharacterized protein n=1 Tax=Thiohalophilus thiocyanatoxydans TaxID=381308 RepID=A0A4R8IJB5_9GAMM|nr:hypothetical protein [Thiohalophilus thiocyanatoxydans]TDX98138.1 hypothetical protein EDC23_2620 [Thiohalophilus thiocyanatoxydans]
MKFSLLAVGQQFEYQGETYIKSTPLIAHQVDSGEQRLIPRSANVISDVNPPGPVTDDAPHIDARDVQQAFAEFETRLQEQLHRDDRYARAFEEAKRAFFVRLKITPDQ